MDLDLQIYPEDPGEAKEGRGGSRIPLGGDAKHRGRGSGVQTYDLANFSKNRMELRKFWTVGACWEHPLDPPMEIQDSDPNSMVAKINHRFHFSWSPHPNCGFPTVFC